ncbi:Acg family FMN-binding oxidoreductase [Nocardiopsis ansamitocini]|uniref:NAD(P)H nitroreductase n=1 Tax=Nocardiopsis ansamitocini TaxID=1670832 RepID=A0A9W6UKY2_9ACTN|nr:hypothetical protein [Nocardiopsis ansamitocini]GLU49535.1 NAD(P)H nitroreductase [Nocardiopsis ansamitocini]
MRTHSTRLTGSDPVRAALRAAERAPSVHNTRPWRLVDDSGRISISTDTDRQLGTADPGARELVISCGAALFNIRTALRAHGVIPRVEVFPDPDRPGLLADVITTEEAQASGLDNLLFDSIEQRRTHRGPFLSDIGNEQLARVLVAAASAEEATLRLVTDDSLVHSLAGLVAAAEHIHRRERAHTDELARWVHAPKSGRPGGMRAADFPPERRVAGALFPDRDYGHGRISGSREVHGAVRGTVALLTTVSDTRVSHLAAGQALERVLLTATAAGVASAFHTQPLEEPLLRAFVTERLCGGAHPQMLMRLGRAGPCFDERDEAIESMLTGY